MKLKSEWKMLKFGDIAQNIAERVNPAEAKTDIYVGLEHLEPGTIHLRQWGHPSDVSGQKLAFKKGDVIFGRRRAYQRKLAVAEFDGICSAHAMVVRAKPKIILPEFLPFFLQSDMFMERAIEISVGSLSPTINWKTLREQVFPLPPIEEQKRIAEILWAADEAVERFVKLKIDFHQFYLSSIEKLCFDKRNPAFKVDQLAKINVKTLSSKTDPLFRFKYLDIGSVFSPKKIGELTEYNFSEAPSRARRVVKSFDILLSTVRPNLQSFVRVGEVNDDLIASTGFAVINPMNYAIGSILFHCFFSKRFSNHCDARVTGTSYPAINPKDIGKFKIYLPRKENEITKLAVTLDAIENGIQQVECNVHSCSTMLTTLIETNLRLSA